MFPSLKYFTQAGGALSRELTKYFIDYSEKNNVNFIIMYGQAEATSRMTYLPYKNLKSRNHINIVVFLSGINEEIAKIKHQLRHL